MHAAKMTIDDLRDAHEAADVLISEPYRKYLFTAGRLLPLLVGRFRDDLAEALDLERTEIPRRDGQVRAVRLDDLTSSEFSVIWGAVDALVERFTGLADDPEFPRLLSAFREELVREKTEREKIADDFTLKAQAS
jgi:hypothetical protein